MFVRCQDRWEDGGADSLDLVVRPGSPPGVSRAVSDGQQVAAAPDHGSTCRANRMRDVPLALSTKVVSSAPPAAVRPL